MKDGSFRGGLARLALAALVAAGGATVGAVAGTSSANASAAPNHQVIRFPLHTDGRFIVDAGGQPVQLAAANWYGAESTDFVVGGLQAQPLELIVRQVRQLGFNAVRLQWSNQMFESDPVVPDYAVAANPELRAMHAMDVFDRVVRALSAQGIMVILDNHNSNAEWCCGGSDGNMLWYNSQYPESSWIADWKGMAERYRDDPLVVGVNLRNEPRSPATWGGPPATNWQAAAERGGDAVLSVNQNLLVIAEGVSYAGDLSGVQGLPVELRVPRRVVYEAHDYAWYESNFTSYAQWYAELYPKWGYLVTGPSPQPVFVGEFGTCNTSPSCVDSSSTSDNGFWFHILTRFLGAYDLSWGYWPLNGTQSTGGGRTWNAPETYGVLNTQWNGIASQDLVARLQQIGG
jgi:endoglucanase